MLLFSGFRRSAGSRYVQDSSRPAPGSMLNPTLPAQPAPFLPPSSGAPLNPSNTPTPAPPPPQFFTPAAPPPSATSVYGDQQQQQQVTQPAFQPAKPPAAMDASVPRGWNDPPPLSGRKVSVFCLSNSIKKKSEWRIFHCNCQGLCYVVTMKKN